MADEALDNRKIKLDFQTQKLGQELQQIHDILFVEKENSSKYAALLRQRNKYLFGKKDHLFFERDFKQLVDRFTINLGKTKFDIGPVQWGLLRDHGVKMFCSFGICYFATGIIRIAPKAFLLPDLTLRGVIFHEATHLDLQTIDYLYDSAVWFSSLVTTGVKTVTTLKDIPDNEKYNNADNWRIFYQKCVKHLAN